VKKNKKNENIFNVVNLDFASLYPSSFKIDERLIAELNRKKTNEKRRQKLEKINNLK